MQLRAKGGCEVRDLGLAVTRLLDLARSSSNKVDVVKLCLELLKGVRSFGLGV